MNFEEKYAKLITEYSLYLRPQKHWSGRFSGLQVKKMFV